MKTVGFVVKEATCTEDGIKEKVVDGQKVEETIPALGHDYSEWNVTVQANCTTDGNETRSCNRCNDQENKKIDKHHTYSSEHTFDENNHWFDCSVCGERIETQAHDFVIDREEKSCYIVNTSNVWWEKLSLGYIDKMTCSDCDVAIWNTQLTKKYDSSFYAYEDSDRYSSELALIAGIKLEYGGYNGNQFDSNMEVIYDTNYNVIQLKSGSHNYLYETDEQGNIVKGSLTYLGHWFAGFEASYKGKQLKTIKTFDMDNEHSYTDSYMYDSDGKLSGIESLWLSDPANPVTLCYENGFYISDNIKNSTYDEFGNRTYFERWNDGNFSSSVTATYNSNNLLESISTSDNSFALAITYQEGKLSSIAYSEKQSDSSITTNTYTYQYDSNGYDYVMKDSDDVTKGTATFYYEKKLVN